jgi:hypothetical protein
VQGDTPQGYRACDLFKEPQTQATSRLICRALVGLDALKQFGMILRGGGLPLSVGVCEQKTFGRLKNARKNKE